METRSASQNLGIYLGTFNFETGTSSKYSVFKAAFRTIQQWVYSLISLKLEISKIKVGFLL